MDRQALDPRGVERGEHIGDRHAELAPIVLVKDQHDRILGVIGERSQLVAAVIERQ
jgi:hypothetical protein